MLKIKQEYCQLKSIKEIAKRHNESVIYVKSVVNDFNKEIVFEKEMFFCYSMDSKHVAYLFDDGREQEVYIDNNIIVNSERFTDYELFWLLKNYGLARCKRDIIKERETITGVEFYNKILKNR